MTDITVEEMAREIEAPVKRLLQQMASAGLKHSKASDIVSDEHKLILLAHLKASVQNKIVVGKTIRVVGDKTVTVREHVRELAPPSPVGVEIRRNEDISELLLLGADMADDTAKADKWSKLSAVEIKNFKAIKSLKVPLSDVTILVGPNGSGKSSVLQAIHWAARAASYVEPKKRSAVVSFDRLDYSPSSEPLKTAHRRELSSLKNTEPTQVGFVIGEKEGVTSSMASVRIWAAKNRSGISVNMDGGAAVTPFKQRTELITAYIPGLAGLSEKETILVQPLLRRQAASGDAGGVLRNVLFNLASRQPGESDSSLAEKRVEKLTHLVQMVHPGVKIEITFDEREDFHINATFEDPKLQGVKRPLENAATGILQVVQIFAYLVLFKPKLLLIDEPDAHLHPDKQERLIEALELAADEFAVQVILTTHSPNIARAASHNSKLVWVRDGEVVDQDDNVIMALLGWGGLDKKVLFFVEDEDADPIRSLLRQWPWLYRQVAICRCFGIDNLPKNSLLKGFVEDNNFGMKVLIHRDRDFMTDADAALWASRYSAKYVHSWVTDFVDAEAYFCQSSYLAEAFSVSLEQAEAWIEAAVKASCKGARDTFLRKRQVMIGALYKNGGGVNSEILWDDLGGIGPHTVLGKGLHKALKVEVKKSGLNDRILDKFVIPSGCNMAPSLRLIIEKMLA